MWNNLRNTLIFVILAIVGAIWFIFYIWTSGPGAAEPASERSGARELVASENIFEGTMFFDLGEGDFIGPALEKIGKSLTSPIFSPQEKPPPPLEDPELVEGQPSPQAITITEQEIFEFGYDPGHVEYLGKLHKQLIEAGSLPSSAAFSVANMAEAIKIQDLFADHLEQREIFSKKEVDLYRGTYRELLPKLWAQELQAKKAGAQSSFLPARIWYAWKEKTIHEQSAQVSSVFEKIKNFLATPAYAAYSISPCYREGTPNLVRGSQRSAPCCNCGLRCTSNGCIFVNDCGESGSSCTIQLGCLNLACPNLPAIWDGRICACYI